MAAAQFRISAQDAPAVTFQVSPRGDLSELPARRKRARMTVYTFEIDGATVFLPSIPHVLFDPEKARKSIESGRTVAGLTFAAEARA